LQTAFQRSELAPQRIELGELPARQQAQVPHILLAG
jgi:hypothetical protein